MKLDKNFIEELVRESLEELQEEEVVEQGDPVPGMEQVHASIEDLQKKIEDLTAENARLKEENARLKEESASEQSSEQEEQPSPGQPVIAMQESFQITKGRLRQIISEEMKSAKEQGLL